MKKLLVMLAVGVMVVAATGFASAVTVKRISSPTRIHVIEVPKTDAVTDTGASGDSAGDLLTFHNNLLNTNKRKVGKDQGWCIRIDPAAGTWECEWTNALSDGHIAVEGPFNDNHGSTLVVTGGTGAYRNARGTMKLAFRKDGNFDFIFKLIP
jgi:hypothetical protein